MDNKQLFLKISAYLTGFSKEELVSTGMYSIYYEKVKGEKNNNNLQDFFAKVASILDGNYGIESRIINAIGTDLIPASQYEDMAKRIILLWYTGIWTSGGKSDMVSERSYIEGLIWAAAETHPAGARQPGYGSWEKKPL